MAKKDKKEIQEKIDSGAYGQPLQFDKNFCGPRGKRSCTDVLCLLVFICFLIGWIVVGSIAFIQGTPLKLVAPYDSDNNQCGVDPGFEGKKYLFYFDFSECLNKDGPISCETTTVCVESCPRTIFLADVTDYNDYKQAICKQNVTVKDEYDLMVQVNDYKCARWYFPTKSIARRCAILDVSATEQQILELGLISQGDWDDIKSGSQIAQEIAQVKRVSETIVSELGKNWPYLIVGFVIAMAFCMIYILIMRWFAWIFVWFSIFAVVGLLGWCVYDCWANYQDVRKSSDKFDITEGIDSILSLKVTWMIFFIASIIVLVVVLLMILFLRNRIRIATALVAEGSRAVGSVASTLFFPLGPWVIQMGVIAWTIAVWIYLASATVPVFQTLVSDGDCDCNDETFQYNGTRCEPGGIPDSCKSCVACVFHHFEDRPYVEWFHAINIIGFFWILCFVSAFSDMALAGTFATWYWTYNKAEVPFFTLSQSVGRVLRYNLGTLAFGALILAICRLIRVVLETISNTLNKYTNGCVKCMLCCMTCFFWCLENFLRFLNRNAYIVCATRGTNFCTSAREAFNLIMRNILRVFVLDKVTDFLFFLGKLSITTAMVILSIHVFRNKIDIDNDDEVPQYTYYLLPVIIVGIGTYFVASIFFSVYAMAVDTLFLCFLEDLERNDGSIEKPFFMSKNLMKILGKKNKKYKERLE